MDQQQSTGKRIVIVGGVAGGASAAARARRLAEDAEIVIFERGEYVSFANCGLPYHVGGTIVERDRLLLQTPASLYKRFRIDVRTRTEVLAIDRTARQVLVRDLKDGREYRQPYDVLILSPGAASIRLPIPGADHPRVLTLRNMADMDAIKAIVDQQPVNRQHPARAVVVGGGYIGLEMVEALHQRHMAVTLVEKLPQVMAPLDPEMAEPVHQQLRLHGVDLRLNCGLTAIREQSQSLIAVLEGSAEVECGLIVMAVGVKPETRLAAAAGLALGERGGIKVDAQMRTSDPAIYAVGDAVEVPYLVGGESLVVPLAGPANRQGRLAADHIFGRPAAYRGTQGTAICKVFDLAAAATGANEKMLRRLGLAYEKVYVHPNQHAEYYPGATRLSLKLLFAPDSGKILGAQAVGAEGVDKRIDVLAVALRAGLTVYDLEHLELCYAPPYGSAKDPVNLAGFVAVNLLRGETALWHAEEAAQVRPDQLLLDVRLPTETAAGIIPGAVSIPVDELRDRLPELPRDKELLVYCRVGLRGHVACRILTQHGFRARNLSGGYITWSALNPAPQPAAPPPPSAPPPPRGPAPGQPPEQSQECACGAVRENRGPQIAKQVDACGLQCPGPIMRLRDELAKLAAGEALTITASDPAFAQDLPAWCASTGNRLAKVEPYGKGIRATVERLAPCGVSPAVGTSTKKKTIVVFSGDFDKVMAAFVIANGAAAMGSEVTMFFTFWGLNALRRPEAVTVRKNFIEKMFGWMMPRGAGRLALSRMHFGGAGLAMIKGIMKQKGVASLEELIGSARLAGVRLVACTMSMDLMGIKPEELVPGVESGGVAMYLHHAEQGNVNLFV